MTSRVGLVWLLLLALCASARADDRVSGFSTTATGELSGRVTDEDGAPLGAIEVHATTKAGELIALTDGQGRYHFDFHGVEGSKLVFVRRVARIDGQALVQSAGEAEGVVEIEETTQPKVMPRSLTSTSPVPEYSQAAKDQDAWTKAWLLLEITDAGTVKRLKVLNSPGYQLEAIAVRAAFKQRFVPARDGANRPVRALILWSYEWPSYWWMIENRHVPGQLPAAVASVPCRGTLSTSKRFRDCTVADVGKAHSLPWIDPPPDLLARADQADQASAVGSASPAGHKPEAPRWYDDKLGWTLAGTGVVLTGTAVLLLISARSLDEEARAASDLDRAHKEDLAHTRRVTGYLLGAAGLTLAGIGTVRLVLQSDGRSSAAVAIAGRF